MLAFAINFQGNARAGERERKKERERVRERERESRCARHRKADQCAANACRTSRAATHSHSQKRSGWFTPGTT